MIPNKSLITISDNLSRIQEYLFELVVRPRRDLVKWAAITKQTPNIKIGYSAQHLASLVTGVEGTRTGARGHDLRDQSEVKSCSRIDQLDRCIDCRASVARLELRCPRCGSNSIRRNNDSKWLFAIKSQEDVSNLIEDVPRVVLILADYPNFDANDWDTIQFQVFEIWPSNRRHFNFKRLITSYYHNIYVPHIRKNPQNTPAPKNLWPYSFQFYMCNPVSTFHCLVENATHDSRIEVLSYVDPSTDREQLEPMVMPASILSGSEAKDLKRLLGEGAYRRAIADGLDQEQRLVLGLRPTDRATPHTKRYQRGGR